ncbi:MAG: Na/Pi cotransporter family protein [Candidatus Methylacidiphilales bacterium]
MLELLAVFLVGLSFFFLGVAAIRTHLQQLTTRRLRKMLATLSDRPWWQAVVGFLSGAVTQSSTAVSFLLAGMISSGAITLRQALPIVGWSNVGVTVLVFLAAIKIDVAILYLLGLSGLGLVFGPSGRSKIILHALYGAGLLFYGLILMKRACAPLPEFEWFSAVVKTLSDTVYPAFVLGLLLRVILQSSSGIAVIAVALAGAGVLSEGQAYGMMLGTGAGVALSVVFLAADVRGVSRQIVWFQGLINGMASLGALALLLVGQVAGVPVADAILEVFPGDVAERLAWGYLLLQGACAALGLGLQRRAPDWLEKWSPVTVEEDLAVPRYLSETALEVPETALDLVQREQNRLMELMPKALDGLREENRYRADTSGVKLLEAVKRVGSEIGAYLSELLERNVDRETSNRLLRMERRNGIILALAENLEAFVSPLEGRQSLVQEEPLLARMIEGLVALMLTAADAAVGRDEMDISALLQISADRSELMEHLRAARMEGKIAGGGAEGRAAVFYATSLFERLVWLVHQFGLSIRTAG